MRSAGGIRRHVDGSRPELRGAGPGQTARRVPGHSTSKYRNANRAEDESPDPLNETAATDYLLVVDDQEANIQVLGSMLGKLGFEILPATSAAQAAETPDRSTLSPDLILLDLLMPGTDGFALCRSKSVNTPCGRKSPSSFSPPPMTKISSSARWKAAAWITSPNPSTSTSWFLRVRTQLMLKSTRDHLKQLAQDKEELLGIISHHLQNHFAGMEMSAQVLLNRSAGDGDSSSRLLAEIPGTPTDGCGPSSSPSSPTARRTTS